MPPASPLAAPAPAAAAAAAAAAARARAGPRSALQRLAVPLAAVAIALIHQVVFSPSGARQYAPDAPLSNDDAVFKYAVPDDSPSDSAARATPTTPTTQLTPMTPTTQLRSVNGVPSELQNEREREEGEKIKRSLGLDNRRTYKPNETQQSNQPQDTIETDSEKQIQKQLENGVKLMVTSKMHEAKAIFKACLTRVDRTRMEQTFRSASFNLGNVHLGLNEPREALRHFMKLRNLTPEFLHVHLAEQFTGAALAQLGRAEEAIHAWDNAIAARKAQRNGTHDHDFWLAVSGHATRAAADAAAAAQRSPSSASHAVTAGLLKFAIGQIDDAGVHLRAAHALRPDHPSALGHQRLGQVEANKGYVDAALGHLRKAVALKPQRAGAWLELGRLECAGGRGDACLDAYMKGFNAEPAAAHHHVIGALRLLRKSHREEEAVALSERAAAAGALLHPMQAPGHLVKELSAQPWRDDHGSWRVAQVLQANYRAIRDEVMAKMASGELVREGVADTEGITTTGTWTELNMYHLSRRFEKNINVLPLTAGVLETLPEVISMVRGAAKVSVIEGGTHLRPHCGPSNTRMRIHLGLSVPPGCEIRVGNRTRGWAEGRTLAFDDSFEHEVWHRGSQPRIALIVDVWHPDMTEEQRQDSIRNEPELLERYIHYKEKVFGPRGLWF